MQSLILPLAFLSIIFFSCSKNKENDGPAQVFSWRFDSGTEQFSDTTSFFSLFGYNWIYARKGTTSLSAGMISTQPALYSTSMANGSVGLTISGAQYGCVTGLINITSNSNNRLSGTFNAEMILANVDTINLTGSFSNIRFY